MRGALARPSSHPRHVIFGVAPACMHVPDEDTLEFARRFSVRARWSVVCLSRQIKDRYAQTATRIGIRACVGLPTAIRYTRFLHNSTRPQGRAR